MLSGLPGAGKSTVANALRAALPEQQLAIIASDRVRKELFPNPTYSDNENRIAHGEVQTRLLAQLSGGRSAIHDATNLQEQFRRWRHEAVRLTGCRVLLIRVVLDEAETKRRIRARLAEGSNISDADFAVYQLMRDSSEPIPSPHLTIHTDGRFQHDIAHAVAHIRQMLTNPAPIVTRRKVFAYITHGDRLLVFIQPNAPEAGVQVPAGTVKEGEGWEEAVLREAWEETGLTELEIASYIGEGWRDMTDYGKHQLHQRRFFHLRAADAHADRWQRIEAYAGDGSQPLFELFWVPINHVPQLIADHDLFVAQLAATLAAGN